jgi:hypothetical protein
MSSTPTNLHGLGRLIALKITESETGAKDRDSEGGERVEKTTGQGLLYTD